MKSLSNTSIAAIFAVGLTGFVVLALKIPFFLDKETQTADEMMLLRYHLHNKYAPLKPDSRIVVAAIDQRSLDDIGRWPFNRSIHGDFLILLSSEKPKAVGWDIFFTEAEAAPNSLSPTPAAATSGPAPTDTNSNPNANSAPSAAANPAPPVSSPAAITPSPAPDTQSPAPAAPSTPPPASTNAAPSSPTTAPGATTDGSSPGSIPIGAGTPADGTNSAPASSATTPASPTPASAMAPAVTAPPPDATSTNQAPATPSSAAPDASNPAPAATTAPPSPTPAPTPAASSPNSAPPAANAAPVPAADGSTQSAPTSSLNPDDQHFVDAASLFPNMVTAAQRSPDQQASMDDADLLPTRALKHVTGDVTKLLSAPFAILPFPELRKVTYFGFADQNGETGGGSRRGDPLVVNVGGKILPSFDLQVLMQYWGANADQVTVNLGHEITLPRSDGTLAHIPIDEKGQMILNYRGKLEDFQVMSYSQMAAGLQAKATGQKSDASAVLPPIKDGIVIIGATYSGIDAGVTPLDNNSPLVVTHLNAINNVLQQDFLRPVSGWIWIPLYALFLFGAGALMLRVGIAPMLPIGIMAGVILAVTAFVAMWFNYQIPVATPELGLILLAGAVPTKRFFGEEREKLRVKKAMSAYLSDRVMAKVLSNPDGVQLGGVKQVITIMFCDIRGFTAYCDNRDPQEVLNVVNEYFEEMTKVVFKYEGTVDKYIGDCIMAFWNAPDDQPDHAQRAVCCAMEMRYALANFKVKRAGLDTELFECGIGIHTGEALVGNMGSTLKVNYTAMGSTVNLGARLESLTKKLNERILISQATFDHLTGDFPLTDRGESMVPGFASPIHVYGVGAEQDLGSAIKVGLKLAKKQEYTADEVTKPIWAPAPLPEDADPNP